MAEVSRRSLLSNGDTSRGLILGPVWWPKRSKTRPRTPIIGAASVAMGMGLLEAFCYRCGGGGPGRCLIREWANS